MFRNVEEIEELEVPVERVEPRLSAVLVPNEEAVFGERNLVGPPKPRVGEAARAHRFREPGHLVAVVGGLVRNDDRHGRVLGPRRIAEHLGKTRRNAVLSAETLHAEPAVRLGHCAQKAHAAGNAIQFRRDEAVGGNNEIGPDHARHVLLEPVLPREFDDLFGLPAIEVLGNECGRGSPRAAIVQIVQSAVEGQKVDSERFDCRGLFCRQCKRLGAYAPGDTLVFVLDPE